MKKSEQETKPLPWSDYQVSIFRFCDHKSCGITTKRRIQYKEYVSVIDSLSTKSVWPKAKYSLALQLYYNKSCVIKGIVVTISNKLNVILCIYLSNQKYLHKSCSLQFAFQIFSTSLLANSQKVYCYPYFLYDYGVRIRRHPTYFLR